MSSSHSRYSESDYSSTSLASAVIPPSGGTGNDTPGSFAAAASQIGTPRSLQLTGHAGHADSPRRRAAWDFMPHGLERAGDALRRACEPGRACERLLLRPAVWVRAEREPHLTPEQVRDEVAAGRMVIPANRVHLGYSLDPMAIGRASKHQGQREHGRLARLERHRCRGREAALGGALGADTVMDLSTGGDLDATREAIIHSSTVPIGTVPIYSMIIGRKIEDLDATR